jgi:hypothetical protein
MVEEVLNESMWNLSSGWEPLETSVFHVIQWAEARRRLTELVLGAAAANPGNPELRALAEQFGAAPVSAELRRLALQATEFANVSDWLARCKRAVCRFEPSPDPTGAPFGTAFLVGPDFVLTSADVVRALVPVGP